MLSFQSIFMHKVAWWRLHGRKWLFLANSNVDSNGGGLHDVNSLYIPISNYNAIRIILYMTLLNNLYCVHVTICILNARHVHNILGICNIKGSGEFVCFGSIKQ